MGNGKMQKYVLSAYITHILTHNAHTRCTHTMHRHLRLSFSMEECSRCLLLMLKLATLAIQGCCRASEAVARCAGSAVSRHAMRSCASALMPHVSNSTLAHDKTNTHVTATRAHATSTHRLYFTSSTLARSTALR